MAILTSTPGEGNKVNIYDVPDDVLATVCDYRRKSSRDVSGKRKDRRRRNSQEWRCHESNSSGKCGEPRRSSSLQRRLCLSSTAL